MCLTCMTVSSLELVIRRSCLLTSFSWGAVVVTFLLLLLSCFITAFIKATRMIDMDLIRARANAGSSQAKSFLRRLESRETLCRELMTASMLTAAVYFVWGALRSVPSVVSLFPCSDTGSRWIYVGLIAVHVLLFLIIGKIMPERVAGGKGGVFAVRFWRLMSMLLFIAKPIERLIHFTSTALMRLFRLQEVEAVALAPTEEEFLQMLEEGRDLGAIVEDNIELFANLFDFDDKIASDIMTHRTDIEALSVDADYEETLSFVNETGYTRFPIYRGSVDNIIGVLHVKDLLFTDGDSFSLEAIMRKAWFTPESRIISYLFHDMQQNHIQMTIVIDEYGGTAGLLTIEDLVEQIVGNIEDEYDEVEQEIVEIAPDTWLVAGSFSLDKLSKVTGVTFEDDEYDSVAGFLIELLDRIPEEDELPSVRYENLVFHILAVSDNRIVRVRVIRDSASDQGDSEGTE